MTVEANIAKREACCVEKELKYSHIAKKATFIGFG